MGYARVATFHGVPDVPDRAALVVLEQSVQRNTTALCMRPLRGGSALRYFSGCEGAVRWIKRDASNKAYASISPIFPATRTELSRVSASVGDGASGRKC